MQRAVGRAGFTLLELVIVLCLVGLLTALAAKRLLVLRVEAERTSLSHVVGGLQAAVSLEMLSLVARERDAELARLPGSNPMTLLMQQPSNYIGELESPDPRQIAPGRWYFDRGRGLLVYRVRYAGRFSTELSGPARARFRIALLYDDRDGNRRFDVDSDGLRGARLEAVEAYAWRANGG